MLSTRRRRRLLAANLLTSAGLGTLSAVPAVAQTSARGVESVIVTGQAYQVDQTSLSKISTPILDTPQSITVVTKSELDDRGVSNLNDALRLVPGISLGAGEFSWQGNNPTIRGFLARNDMYLDGIRDFGSYNRDPFDLQQIEVLTGPSSIYFGRGSTGGAINQVTKTPFLSEAFTGSVAGGTDNTRRVTGDYNLPLDKLLGEGAAVRLNAMADIASTADRDTGKQRRWGIAPSLALGLGTPTRLTVTYLHQDENDIPDYGTPWYFGRPAPVPRNTYYGFSDDYLKASADILTGKAEHDFSPDITLRDTLRYAHYTRDLRVTEALLAGTVTATTPLASINVARNEWIGTGLETQLINNTEVAVRFTTGPLHHAAVAGIDLGYETSKPLFENAYGVPLLNLENPGPAVPFNYPVFSRVFAHTGAHSIGLYGIDTINLNEQWELTAGLRWDRFSSVFDETVFASVPSAPSSVPTTLNPPVLSHTPNVDSLPSYRLGLVYKPQANGSVYFSTGTSFDPSAENLSQITSGRSFGTQNSVLPPEKNKSYELGTKWQLLDNHMLAHAALFRLEKDNARVPGPVPGVNVLAGKQRVDGFETALSGGEDGIWNASLTYTYLDSHQIGTTPGGPLLNAPLVNTPKDEITFNVAYNILDAWSVGTGGQYVSQRLAQNTAASYLTGPPYFTLDLFSKYRINQNFVLQLNVYNALDRTYYDLLHPFHVVPGAGRSALLTLSAQL